MGQDRARICCYIAVNLWPPGCPGFVDFIRMMGHGPEDFTQKTEKCFWFPLAVSLSHSLFSHYGEVNQKHAAEMTAVCNERWGLTAKLLTVTSRRCFCRETWSQWSRLGIWTITAKGKARCLLLPSVDPKPLWHRKDLLQQLGLGKEHCGVSPLTGHWCFCILEWFGHHQVDERPHDCTPARRRIYSWDILQYISKHCICEPLNINWRVVFSL